MTKHLIVIAMLAAGCSSKSQAPAAAPSHGVRLVYEVDPSASPFKPDSGERALEQGLETLRKRIDALDLKEPSVLIRDGRIVVELPPIPEEQLESLRTLFARRERLEFRMVADELIETRRWVRLATEEPPTGPAVRAELDQWTHYESNEHHQDSYLVSTDRKALERFVTEVALPIAPLPDGHRVAYERVTPPSGSGRDTEWRTYVLDGQSGFVPVFVRADVQFDPDTNRPMVEAELDKAGARAFAELTRANVGRKLAMVIGDTINSAPVIQSEIGGGKVWISMGGDGAPDQQQREAQDLALTLRATDLAMPLVLARIEQF